ncbi:uncharacterized protein LOC143245860 [Tachypleus tridentatus]|uniref:uncharacterized protein LOC143245860 n=1 Tax=Tachypleus tridentatus TaxID=6853 RepID=UPI003FD52CE4
MNLVDNCDQDNKTRAESSAEVPSVTTGGGLFSKGSKFRYSGRVEKEVIEVMTNFHRDPPQFQRSFLRTLSFRHKSESYPTTPATPSKDYETDFPDLHYMNHSAPATENVDSMTSTDSSSLKYTNRSTQMTGSLSDLTLPEHEEVAILPLEGEEDQHIKQLDSHIVEELEDLIEEDRPAELEVSLPPLRASTPQITKEVEQETHNAQVSTSESQLTGKNFELDFNITKQKNLARSRPFLSRPVNIVRVTILASLFALLTFWCLLVVVMESDSPLFSDARKLPELIVLRREYYEPAKDYIVERLKFLF